ncbi:hypothetical protein [Humisphaera borealis]|uniref:Type II secretion system protein M n=1 Tax=Humisphaera borealis TaxID=2807512 RepID=A0A7M2WWP6_9BACT|nr:hypothetical protein [Humisphaera borealis]QOV89823.1 hypothetical protein IPV69_00160 [Humisphaera borealis]
MNNMSPRERSLALIVLSVVGVALLYQFVIDPYFQKRRELKAAIELKEDELNRNRKLFNDEKRLKAVLTNLNAGGLKTDVAEARSQLLYAISSWTKDSGVNLSSLKEGRTTSEGKWIQINTQASGTGPQKAIANLLWRVETASIPVRVTEMTVNSRREGTDDLQINLGVSTLCANPDGDKPETPGRRPVASIYGSSVASGREP